MEIYKTSGVCSSEIEFIRGCPGNALGVVALVKGLPIEEVINKLKGIDCRNRGTSCPDQLARALEAYIKA